MESYNEDNTLLDEKSKKILEEIEQEMSSIREEMQTLVRRNRECGITEEMATIWGEKLAYQGKYVNLLAEKLNDLLDEKNSNT